MNYYDDIALGYDELHKEEQMKKILLVLERVRHEVLLQGPVLDVGCGTGFSLDIIHQSLLRPVIGIDPSQGLLSQYTGNHQVLLALAENIPLLDESCSAVLSFTALQNFTDIPKAICEMRRVAKPRAPIIVTCLKKSVKLAEVSAALADHLCVEELVEQEQDIIFFCRRI